MTDEIFRDGFCDDIFRSMKMQMEPSDDVVGSLLAKIAAESSSQVTENDNVIPFRPQAQPEIAGTAAAAAAVESAPRKHFANNRKKTNKSIWYYGTAVAASIIVMISTFALLGPDGDDASGVQDLFEQAVGPGTQIVNMNNPGEEGQAPVGGDETVPPADVEDDNRSEVTADGSGQDGRDSDGSGESTGSEGNTDAAQQPGKTDETQSGKTDGKDSNDANDGKTGNEGKQPEKNPSNKDDSDKPAPDKEDNGKVTPGAEGTSEIPWTNEIISTSQVASISVSNGNYVVDGTAVSRSDVGETIEVVTIALPQTSTTNAAEVKAKVRQVNGVSAAAMVALDVEGFDQPLVYANADYAPSTLGQLVSDLGLEKKTTFSGNVRCQISMVGYSSNHSYSVDTAAGVWTYLLNQTGAQRVSGSEFANGNAKALFTSDSNQTGSQIQFGVSDSGYLYVSMMGKKHTFHIGAENAKGFIEYVTGETLE